jgi:hypothetical protein
MNLVEQAAERVLVAQRALSIHRHSSAPTLEREYQRALEAYFEAAERAMGRRPDREESIDAIAATLAADLDRDSEALADDAPDPRTEETQHTHAAIAAHYAAAHRAIRLVRTYRGESSSSGRRERESLEAVSRHRDAVRRLRLQMRRSGEQLALPGLVKTRPGAAETGLRIKAG